MNKQKDKIIELKQISKFELTDLMESGINSRALYFLLDEINTLRERINSLQNGKN